MVCRSREQVRCHKSILAAASPFVSFLLQELGEQQQDAVLFLDEVEAVHLRSLLSLLYNGWADAESTGHVGVVLWEAAEGRLSASESAVPRQWRRRFIRRLTQINAYETAAVLGAHGTRKASMVACATTLKRV